MSAARADTASDLAAAREKASQLQAQADAAASVLVEAEDKAHRIADQITELESQIERIRERVQVLSGLVRDRGVAAYVSRAGGSSDAPWLLDAPIDAARREKFLQQANQADDRLSRSLEMAKQDLAIQQRDVERQREEQKKVQERVRAEFAVAQTAVQSANAARDELAAKLAQEKEAAAQAEAARLRELAAARQAAAAVTRTSGGNSAPGQVIANPGGGSFQCPVVGSSYNSNYGQRGSGFHSGLDMFIAVGSPIVAVKSGTVTYVPNAGAGGNETYLAADDGNVYYYAHASSFVGGPRRVVQGEVVALVGMTGNTSAPHLHFEIRIGGPNGQRIDPYPTVRGAGC